MTVTVKPEHTEIEIMQSYFTSDERIEIEIIREIKITICCTIAVVITLISVLIMLDQLKII